MENKRIHPLADVQSTSIGSNTNIWQFCVILKGASIGENCNICAQVFIENDVVIGNDVTIKNGVQLWDGVNIGNQAFIGPNVTFTNDLYPRSKQYPNQSDEVHVGTGASIGANATIIGPVTIGDHALIGAGTVVNRDIPKHTVWVGNPARQIGFISKSKVRYSMEEAKNLQDFDLLLSK